MLGDQQVCYTTNNEMDLEQSRQIVEQVNNVVKRKEEEKQQRQRKSTIEYNRWSKNVNRIHLARELLWKLSPKRAMNSLEWMEVVFNKSIPPYYLFCFTICLVVNVFFLFQNFNILF